MKRIVLIILIILIFIMSSSCINNELKYEIGKDTVEHFGDGTYQVIHQVDKSGDSTEILSNLQYKQCMITSIDEYKKVEDNVYFIGKYYEDRVCCIIDMKTNVCKYYIELDKDDEFIMVYSYEMQKNNDMLLLKTYEEFSKEEQQTFEMLDASV